MAECLIGIDAGTTNMKVAAFGTDGRVIAAASAPTPERRGKEGADGYDPEQVWQLVAELARRTVDALPEGIVIAGVAVAGVGESGLLMDRDGNALSPLVAWFDRRPVPIWQWWKDTFPEERILSITGLRPQYIFAVNKLMWMRGAYPDAYRAAYKWCCLEGFLSYRMTGRYAMARSIGCRTMLMDLHSGMWSEELLQHAQVPQDMLPPLVDAGEEVGTVTPRAAELLSIPAGTPVFAAGHDHVCGAFACGVSGTGEVLDSMGTAELVLTPVKEDGLLREKAEKGFIAGPHVIGGYVISGGITASGAAMDWFNRISGISRQNEEGKKVPGAHGMLFLPHIRGGSSPARDARSKGAFLGVTDNHTMHDFSQAVCEGLGMEFRLILEQIIERDDIRQIIATGGGTRNAHLLQTKANIVKFPICVPEVEEATALGAAMLAGVGSGVYRNEAEAIRQTRQGSHIYRPDPAASGFYDRQFEIYRDLYQTLIPIYDRMQ